jgi:RimJ/RimL family protein N-acetyltransferase
VQIRVATAEDADAIARIHVAGWQWGYRALIPASFLDALSVERRAASWKTTLATADPPTRVLIASRAGRDVGICAVGLPQDAGHPPLTAYVGAIYLVEEVARTGIGSALLEAALEDAARRGFRRAYLWCLADRAPARAFYEKRGFRHDGVTKAEDRGEFVARSVRYVRDLAGAATPAREIVTARMLLRPWRDEDLAPFAELNADPAVMELFPKTLSREESDALAARIRRHGDEHGFGLWAVELPGVAPFIGFIGLSYPHLPPPFAPSVEIGWRLARAHWNRGLATEGARAALDAAFRLLHLTEVVAMTVPANVRSRAVMEKLGMHHAPEDDFDHPKLPEGHPLRRHLLYRI